MAIKICRICLALDVKVFKLGNSEAKCFLENIFKQNGYKQDLHESHYICFECKALLDKTYSFISRVLQAQDILFHVMKENKIITPSCFDEVDRKLIGYNLVKDLKYIDIFITEDVNKKKENVLNITAVDYKVEVDDLGMPDPLENHIDDFNFDKKDLEIDFGFNLEVEPADIDSKVDIKLPFNDSPLAEEIDYTSFNNFDDAIQYEYNEAALVQVKKEIGNANTTQIDNIIKNRKRKHLSKVSKNTSKAKQGIAKQVQPLSKKVKIKRCGNNNHEPNQRTKPRKQKEGKQKYGGEYSKLYDGCIDLNQQIQQPIVPNYPAKCDHCSYEVPNRTAHFHHYLLEHKDKKYPYAKQTGKQFVCQFCGVVNNKKSRHIDHELTHGTVNNFACSQCPKSFLNRHRLQKHTYRSHPLQMLECDYCGKKVKSRESLMIHIRAHTGERPFKCPFCGAGFAHRGNIRPHIRANHEQCLERSDFATKTNKGKTIYEATNMQILAPNSAKLCASEMFMHLSSVMNLNNI